MDTLHPSIMMRIRFLFECDHFPLINDELGAEVIQLNDQSIITRLFIYYNGFRI